MNHVAVAGLIPAHAVSHQRDTREQRLVQLCNSLVTMHLVAWLLLETMPLHARYGCASI